MADNNNTGKILAILGITAGVGVGLYFLLKPKTASAKTNTGLTPSQQAQIDAARLKAKQGGGNDKAVENAVKAALAKIAVDKAKDLFKPSKGGSGPSGGGSGGGGGNDKTKKTEKKSEGVSDYICNYYPDDPSCSGSGGPSNEGASDYICNYYPDDPSCSGGPSNEGASDYCNYYPDDPSCSGSGGGSGYDYPQYDYSGYSYSGYSGYDEGE